MNSRVRPVWQVEEAALRAACRRVSDVQAFQQKGRDLQGAVEEDDGRNRTWMMQRPEDGRSAPRTVSVQHPWAWHILAAREKTRPASLLRAQQDCSPVGREVSMSASSAGFAATNLALAFPIADILDETSTADVHVRARSDEHIAGRNDIGDWRVPGVVAWQPDSDRDVVGCSAESYWKQAMQTEQELGPSVVVS